MSVWRTEILRNCSDFVSRGVSPKYVDIDGYPVINQKCIRGGTLNYDHCRLTSKTTRISNEKFLFDGDILINSTGTGTLGRTAFIRTARPNTTVDSHVTIVRPNSVIHGRYLGYFLRSIESEIESLGKGATNQKELAKTDVEKISISYPPLPDQINIAGVLSAYDDLIDANVQSIKLLEEMAQITYEEWFVRFRFPGFEKTPIDPETGLPRGWQVKNLGQVTNYIKRGIAPKYVDSDGVVILNQKCVRANKIDYNPARMTTRAQKIASEKFLQKYDILINSTGTGTLGRPAQFFGKGGLVTVDSHITIVRANTDTSKYFLGRFIERSENQIEALGKGATNQKELGAKDLADTLLITVPKSETVDLFDQYAEPLFKMIENLSVQNTVLKEARDLLLPRLMTGMIDIDDYLNRLTRMKGAA